VPLRERPELVIHKAVVPDLDRVAKASIAVDGEPRPPGHARVSPAGQRQGLHGVPGQEREERFEPLPVVGQHRGQLSEKRPQLLAQREDARGKEVRERSLNVLKPQDVRHV
jgi:hypothetical protein